MFRSLVNKVHGNFINHYRLLKRELSTIFALSSGYGKSGVAVIRVSGPNTVEVVKRFGGFNTLPDARKATLRKIKDPNTSEVLDQGLILWFPGPRSFTGEDCCEFHVHGSIAVISSILTSLASLPNLRPAEPGEFTKRAFLAGKLDLTAVEGLNDLINAETHVQRRQALLQMEGSLFNIYTGWTNILLKCVTNIEAYIDFAEDQRIDNAILKNTRNVVTDLRNDIKKHLQDGRRGERIRNGLNLTILGPPNVGKSSLLNKLCRRPAAIVSPLAGTTRDLIRIDLDIGGYPVKLTDTAGIRLDTTDQIELEGVTRTKLAASDADLILLVIDCANFIQHCLSIQNLTINLKKEKFPTVIQKYLSDLEINSEICQWDNFIMNLIEPKENGTYFDVGKVLLIFNKIDLIEETQQVLFNDLCEQVGMAICPISCRTEKGFELLMETLIKNITYMCGRPSMSSPSYTQIRHRICLMECLESLNSYLNYVNEEDVDLAGHCLRNALYNLGKITGHISVEQILDKIFADFCIGK